MTGKQHGFTLIELLIVTVVIATLMGIVFRLAGAGGDNRKKALTIDRLQRIENALSGYYAAYGSYPPVPLQGRTRSIYAKVDGNGIQETGNSQSGNQLTGGDAASAWDKMGSQVIAACKAQPVAVYFPFNSKDSEVEEAVQNLSQQRIALGVSSRSFTVIKNVGGFDLQKSDWRECSVFQFGLLSFLLPRYLFMLDGDTEFYDYSYNGKRCGQWSSNNQLPCRLDNGDQFESWEQIQKILKCGRYYRSGSSGVEASMVSNITSQSVCARWMPNFEGIISGGREFFGVDTSYGDSPYMTVESDDSLHLSIHTPKGYSGGSGSGGSLYLLNGMTVRDGWGNDFFYYSEPPYQSYRLWSAGPDGRTFPVWYDRSQLSGSALTIVQAWTADDISGLNN